MKPYRSSILYAAAALALLPAAALAGTAGHAPKRMSMAGKANAAGVFHVRCAYAHSANDDPIAMPGQPGLAMLHDFFANRATDAGSTSASLMNGQTTCATAADASGYWTPALYGDGQRLLPTAITTYWRAASKMGPTAPLPVGLQMIAGDKHATSPQPLKRVSWDCHASNGPRGTRNHGPRTSAPHQCSTSETIRLTITFPSCWDGHTLTGAGQTNVVDAVGARCPTSHPVALPKLTLHAFYPSSAAREFTLSMGPGMEGSIYSAHADFLNAWNPSVIQRLITTCLSGHRRCGAVKGPGGAARVPALR
jgi:hypothetical protein